MRTAKTISKFNNASFVETLQRHIVTILVSFLFLFVISLSIATNRSACRMFVYKVSTKIETLTSK